MCIYTRERNYLKVCGSNIDKEGLKCVLQAQNQSFGERFRVLERDVSSSTLPPRLKAQAATVS